MTEKSKYQELEVNCAAHEAKNFSWAMANRYKPGGPWGDPMVSLNPLG